jgi:guanine deaminase
MNKFMEEAIKYATKGLRDNQGGPFGAVIVQNGEIISYGNNQVTSSNDPTAHAEIVAIRMAAKKLNRFDLHDCEIYSTCEPCPMCLAAIHWAKIPTLFYGCTRKDAAKIGFDDDLIYDVIKGTSKEQPVKFVQIDREECIKPFEEWEMKEDKVMY